MPISKTPAPPYYAVIFTSQRTEGDNGYRETADQMVCLAEKQAGFLGAEREASGLGITVSYWDSLESIRVFRELAAHKDAQQNGRDIWYSTFGLRVCKVEKEIIM